MHNMVTHSLYFSQNTHKKSHFVKGFMLKNPNLSVGNAASRSKPSKKFNTSTSENEESIIEFSSSPGYQSPRRPPQERISRVEELQLERSLMLKTNGSLLRKLQNQMTRQTEQLPQLASQSQGNIVRINLQSRLQKTKPATRKQVSQDFTISFKHSEKKYIEVKEGLSLRSIFLSGRNDVSQLLLVNFENLLMQQRKSFWEYRTDMKICNNYLIGKIMEQCESSYCPCGLRQDLRNTLRVLAKYYLIVLLFNTSSYGMVWTRYLYEQGYNFDAAYTFKASDQIDLIGFKLSRLLSDLHLKCEIKRILHLDSLMLPYLFYSKLPPELFQYKIPLCTQDVTIYFFQPSAKYFDCRSMLDLCLAHHFQQSTLIMKRPITIHHLDLQNVFQFYFEKQRSHQTRKSQLKEFQIVIKRHKIEKKKSNSIYKWVDDTRAELLETFKNKVLEKVPLLHFTVGDLIVRNHLFREQYYNNPELLQIQAEIVSQLSAILPVTQKIIPRETLQINSFLFIET